MRRLRQILARPARKHGDHLRPGDHPPARTWRRGGRLRSPSQGARANCRARPIRRRLPPRASCRSGRWIARRLGGCKEQGRGAARRLLHAAFAQLRIAGTPSVNIDISEESLNIRANYDVETSFLGIIGIDKLKAGAFRRGQPPRSNRGRDRDGARLLGLDAGQQQTCPHDRGRARLHRQSRQRTAATAPRSASCRSPNMCLQACAAALSATPRPATLTL